MCLGLKAILTRIPTQLQTRSAYFLGSCVHASLEFSRELGAFGVAGWEDLAGVEAAETGFAIDPL
jgi:hypothetical protein